MINFYENLGGKHGKLLSVFIFLEVKYDLNFFPT